MMGNPLGADFFQNDFHCSGGEVPGHSMMLSYRGYIISMVITPLLYFRIGFNGLAHYAYAYCYRLILVGKIGGGI